MRNELFVCGYLYRRYATTKQLWICFMREKMIFFFSFLADDLDAASCLFGRSEGGDGRGDRCSRNHFGSKESRRRRGGLAAGIKSK